MLGIIIYDNNICGLVQEYIKWLMFKKKKKFATSNRMIIYY